MKGDLGKALKDKEGLNRLRRARKAHPRGAKWAISPGELKPGVGMLEFLVSPGRHLEAGIGGREMLGEFWPLSDSEHHSGADPSSMPQAPGPRLR